MYASSPYRSGPYTVKAAIEGYMADYTARSGKGTSRYEYFVNAHILPKLGDIEVSYLTLERSCAASWVCANVRTFLPSASAMSSASPNTHFL